MDPVAGWESLGSIMVVRGHEIFVIDRPADEDRGDDPILVLHGFPTCSFDWRHVLPSLGARRRVILLDMLGYGLSAKPFDTRYSLFEQADIVEATLRRLGIGAVALLTHDMGNSVGGELLARALNGQLGFSVGARIVTNGSIYMDLAHLSAGQMMLLELPDEVLPPDTALTPELFKPALSSTFAPATQPSDEELDAQWSLLSRGGGDRILPRLIRYIEERRAHEGRWTAALEKHPAPLLVAWGDADPIAVYPMAERLVESNPDAHYVRLEGIGHYPMIEAPSLLAAAIMRHLD
ncbi:MAG: alpha/beta fold hydrolase [Actinomycetota bacterium]